ncbi:hypothetical protein Bca4012_027890 [Brassica carinata]|uniref:RING-type domain-containing protein n=1 Tax=Brassica carinata TaxID=52824 RepID=A0A8X7VKV0_BRACI|nr:hypothetical protein Bca52824_024876 [Brassica carinata]
MVADSITDSQLFRGSPIARDDFKKRKANLLRKIDDARRSQWIHQCEEEDGCSRLRDKPPEIKTLSDRFSHLRAWSVDDDSDDDETGLSAATASSPTSVLKNKDSDCFCCSKQLTEEEEASVDANDEEEEGPSQSDHNKSTSTAKPEEPSADQKKKKEDECCPLCAEKMDKTDLRFKPCSSCEYKVCLFCYKRINEDTGVCPGCRTKYEQKTGSSSGGEVTFQQQRGGDPLPLSSAFQGLDSD